MATKLSNHNANIDGNWQWPEKTWFRERLNAVKARENEERRKPIVKSRQPTLSAEPDSDEKDPIKVD
jgi:hypothetical protein